MRGEIMTDEPSQVLVNQVKGIATASYPIPCLVLGVFASPEVRDIHHRLHNKEICDECGHRCVEGEVAGEVSVEKYRNASPCSNYAK
jgi:hypothetical protein